MKEADEYAKFNFSYKKSERKDFFILFEYVFLVS